MPEPISNHNFEEEKELHGLNHCKELHFSPPSFSLEGRFFKTFRGSNFSKTNVETFKFPGQINATHTINVIFVNMIINFPQQPVVNFVPSLGKPLGSSSQNLQALAF